MVAAGTAVLLALPTAAFAFPTAADDDDSSSTQTVSQQSSAPANHQPRSAGATTQGIIFCTFFQKGDYAHLSTWDKSPGAARTASAHGWWENVDCRAQTANVTVQLQAYVNGAWRNAGAPGVKKNVYSGGGSANRAAAQSVCASYTSTRWRSVIDVDLVGQDDSAEKLTTPERTLACRPQL